MAIEKVTRKVNGVVTTDVLGMDDILVQIGAKRGETTDFFSLAEVIGLDLEDTDGNPISIVLPDSFEGEDLTPSAGEATANPTSLSFTYTSQTKTIGITAQGIYRISSAPSWVQLNRTFARNNESFSVTATNNSEISSPSRSGNIVFKGASNTTIATVSITQAGNPLTATISPSSTQNLNGSAGTTSITIQLSDSLTPTTPILSNEDEEEFTLSTPTQSTSNSITTYIYTLTRFQTSSARTITITFGYTGDGISDEFAPLTFNQAAFQPTISRTPTSLSYTSGGSTKYYDVTSNTNWTATIASTTLAYQHSLQSDRNFTFDALTGTSAGDRIYVKAAPNSTADIRTGTATITTTYGTNDVDTTVSLSQAAAATWDDDDITITGFAVASNGDITAPTVTTTDDVSYTIQYATANTFTSTTLRTATDGFEIVSSDTTRYVRVSVTVPSGYSNAGVTFRKTAEATQDGLPIFKSSQITLGNTTLFRVNSYGTITAPNVSVPSGITVTLRYTTGNNNTGAAYTKFPKVSTAITRYANAVVVVPAGYFNVGSTVTKTVNDVQEVFDPTLSITITSLSFVIGGQTKYFDVVSNHSWVSVISNLGDAEFQQSLSSTSGFSSDDLSGSGNDRIYIKTAENLGEDRTGAVNVETNFGSLDNSDGVVLFQVGEPTFGSADWTGVVSINRQTGAVSATTGNSLTTPTFTPTSFALVSSTTSRTVSVTVKAPDNFNNHNALVTFDLPVSQLHFVPSVSVPASLTSFAYTGQTRSYTVTSNTTWSATITGAGFSHSTSPTTGFKTTAITGTSAGDTIYVKAAGHLGAERYGTATVTTTFGGNDVSDEVDLTQLEAPTYTGSDISISGFAVNYAGTITAPTVSPAATAIVYSTATNGGGTAYSTFPTVSSNTTRYCKVTVTVPAGYQNTGNSVSRTVTTTQPFRATINVSPNSHEFSNVGSYRDYGVTSNTTWTVSSVPSWIEIDDTTGGGSDTVFRATATAQANPAQRRYDDLVVSTNTATNGPASETVAIEQGPRAIWSLDTIPTNSLDGHQWTVYDLKSTTASLTKFNFNVPYVFTFEDTTAGTNADTNFDKTYFGFFVNNGAGRSTTSHTLTTGNKTFTLTPNNDVLPIENSISFTVGTVVSLLVRNPFGSREGAATKYMRGNVTGWNSTTKALTVNIPTNSYIERDGAASTTSYNNWEINQISGDATTFPRLYTRNDNITGTNKTTTIKFNDINNSYELGELYKGIIQPSQPLSGYITLPASVDVSRVDLDNIGYYTNSNVSNTVGYYSVGIKTNYTTGFTITKSGSSSIWIATSSSGAAQSSISVNSSTGNIAAFYIRYNEPSAGSTITATITITGADEPSITTLEVSLSVPSSDGGGPLGPNPPRVPPGGIQP